MTFGAGPVLSVSPQEAKGKAQNHVIVCQVSVLNGFQGNLGRYEASLFIWLGQFGYFGHFFGELERRREALIKLFITSKLEMWISVCNLKLIFRHFCYFSCSIQIFSASKQH